jgi:hypothetical protein
MKEEDDISSDAGSREQIIGQLPVSSSSQSIIITPSVRTHNACSTELPNPVFLTKWAVDHWRQERNRRGEVRNKKRF